MKTLAKDLGTNRFWMNQSCFAYVKMLEKLISSSKTARNEFYNFLNGIEEEDEDSTEYSEGEDSMMDEGEKEEYDEVLEGVGRKTALKSRNTQSFTNRSDREKLIGMLMRVQHDLLLFLATSPTQKPIWWNVNIIYQLLCSFFKNLCENNYLKFKQYLGEFVPKVEDESWNSTNNTCMEIFTNQLQYLLNCSKLAENRTSVMVHSD
jgi:hypothetical protein